MELQIITIPQALQLLKAVGAPVAEITAEEAKASKDADGKSTFNMDTVISEIDKSRTNIIKPLIESELKKANDEAIDGRVVGAIKAFAKRSFGLKQADMDGLSESEILEKGLNGFKSTLSKDTEGLRQELENASGKHREALQKQKDEYEGKLKLATDRYIERDIDTDLFGIVNETPRVAGDAMFQTKGFKNFLRENYNVVFDEKTGKTVLRAKDNIEMPAYNEAGTVILTPKDLASTYFEKLGAVVKDQRHQNPKSALTAHQSGLKPNVQTVDAGTGDELQDHMNQLIDG